jgi:hypothetical protein
MAENTYRIGAFMAASASANTTWRFQLSRAAKAKNVQPAATNSRLHQRNAFFPRSSSPGSA